MKFMDSRFLSFLSFLLIFSLMGSSGCSKKKHIRGKAYVDREVFVDILVDIHLVDGITNDRKFYRRYTDTDSIDLLSPILEKYGVTHTQFDSTLAEYSRYPSLLDQVYNDVLMKLNVMLDENDREEAPDGEPGFHGQ
ncbi:MAG TPA: DUF4296 domain-containing protein [Bacteroides sp.]|nr:DUF4296 domain-containing protein [Bacteroides sp.]